MSDDYTPTTEEVEGMLSSYLYEYGVDDVNMNELGNSPDEIVDRWLAEVRREAAEKALTDLACEIEATAKRTDNTFTEHAVVEAGGLELLREAAEAYQQEREER